MIEYDENQEDLDFLLKQRGKPTASVSVAQEELVRWQGILPNRLLFFWQKLGWCSFADGLLWLVNPDDYTGMVDMWLEGTKYKDIDTFHCIARTAFGKMIVYGEKNKRTMKIMPQHATIWVDDKKVVRPQKCGDIDISVVLGFSDDEDFDIEDINGNLLYPQAVKKLGKLEDNEIYAFEPFLLLLQDEQHTIDYLTKVRMDAQLYLLRETFEPVSRGTSYSDIYK